MTDNGEERLSSFVGGLLFLALAAVVIAVLVEAGAATFFWLNEVTRR